MNNNNWLYPFPNAMNPQLYQYNLELKNLENRIYNLEVEVNKIKNSLQMSNKKDNDYSSSYKPNTYNMM